MKRILTDHRLMRMISASFFISAVVVFFLSDGRDAVELSVLLMFSADMVLQLYPVSNQGVTLSWIWIAVYSAVIVAVIFLRIPVAVLLPLCCICLFAYVIMRFRQRFHKARLLFCANNVMIFIRDISHSFYSTVTVLLAALLPVLLPFWNGAAALSLCALLFAALYYRAYTSRTLFVSPTFEREVFGIARGEIRNVGTANFINDNRMEAIYSKVLELMENEKVYLESSYSIYDLAQQTGTNKSYVSRVVNIYSGRNFCQFINWYRVHYAVSYVNEYPSVRVTELALKSGFNSNVTFNAAFRMFMGCSPGDYIQEVFRAEK